MVAGVVLRSPFSYTHCPWRQTAPPPQGVPLTGANAEHFSLSGFQQSMRAHMFSAALLSEHTRDSSPNDLLHCSSIEISLPGSLSPTSGMALSGATFSFMHLLKYPYFSTRVAMNSWIRSALHVDHVYISVASPHTCMMNPSEQSFCCLSWKAPIL